VTVKSGRREIDQTLIVLVHIVSQHIAIFDYEPLAEREEDIQLVCHFPDRKGEAGATVPASIAPVPPKRASQLLACFRWIRMKISSKKRRT
jgi:hypothetical protein